MKIPSKGPAVDSFLLIIVRIVTVLISIVIYKLMAVYFSLEDYGVYSAALLVATTTSSIIIMGLADSVNYFFNRENDKTVKEKYISTSFYLQIILGMIGAGVIIVFREKIGNYFGDEKVVNMLIIVSIMPLLTNLVSMLQVLYVSCGKAKIIAVRNFTVSSIKLLVVLLACIYIRNIVVVLVGTVGVDALLVIYMFIYAKKRMINISVRHFEIIYIKEILAYSIPMAAYIITNGLFRNIDKLVIGRYGNSEELALYTICSKELPFDMFTIAFLTVLLPYITRFISSKDYSNATKYFSKYIQLSYIVVWMMTSAALICSKELLIMLYDPKYISGLPVFIIYIIVEMFKFANVSLVFSATGKTKELFLYSSGALVGNYIMNIVFFNLFGIVGPAISTVIVTFLLSFILVKRSAMLLKSSIYEMFDLPKMITVIIEYGLISGGAIVIRGILENRIGEWWSDVLAVGLFLILVVLRNYKRIIGLLHDINQLRVIE